MLQTVPQGEVLLHMPALQPQQLPTAPPVPLLLLLTPEVLFIISQAEDCQQRAFAVGEVECQRGTPGDGRLVLVPQTKSTKLQKTSWVGLITPEHIYSVFFILNLLGPHRYSLCLLYSCPSRTA